MLGSGRDDGKLKPRPVLRDRRLEVTATSLGRTAEMGDALAAPAGAAVRVTIHVSRATGGAIGLVGDGPKPKLADATLAGYRRLPGWREAHGARSSIPAQG